MNKIAVFKYRGQLAYATAEEYAVDIDFMYMILPGYSTFEEAKSYLVDICNYNESDILDYTEREER